jgi:hypothetical protein
MQSQRFENGVHFVRWRALLLLSNEFEKPLATSLAAPDMVLLLRHDNNDIRATTHMTFAD